MPWKLPGISSLTGEPIIISASHRRQEEWLTSSRLNPHEDQWTDIILLGHSMGGLLAADVALTLRHRIIGVVNFDVPFLGMHPGIVKAGLGSIFDKPPAPQDVVSPESEVGPRPSRMATIFNPKPSDPNYNPAFPNDVNLPVRKGWENALHWFNKHSDSLKEASKGLIKSHLEFGGAMADYKTLKDRYARIRALEEDDEDIRSSANPEVRSPPRIRFVNYYTASTGRPKKPKMPRSPSPECPATQSVESHDIEANTHKLDHYDGKESVHTLNRRGSDASAHTLESQPEMTHIPAEPMVESPRVSIHVEEQRGNEFIPVDPQEPLSATSPGDSSWSRNLPSGQAGPPDLPEIPSIPQEPPFIDLMQYTDKSQRKAAEKEHDQALKAYQKAVKARNRVINERTKMQEKYEKQQKREQKQREKETLTTKQEAIQSKAQETEDLKDDLEAMQIDSQLPKEPISHAPYNNYDFSRSTILSQPTPDDRSSIADSAYTNDSQSTHTPWSNHQNTMHSDKKPEKPKKLKKFCMLPPKDAAGNKDPTWIRVYMSGMDEVTAHTSLFFLNETYERLVGDVGARIEEWVKEADSVRLVREMEGLF